MKNTYNQNAKFNVDLISLTLGRDSRGYYMHARYRVEDTRSVREVDIPKIRLNIDEHCVVIDGDRDKFGPRDSLGLPRVFANIGLGWCGLEYGDESNKVYFTETIIEEKTKEMTLEEIERELGHKVKIVNKA